MDLLLLVPISAVTFAATGLDSFLVMVPAIAGQPARAPRIAAGYLVALGLIVLVSWAAATGSEILISGDPGILGVVPVVMGCVALFRRIRSGEGAGTAAASVSRGGFGAMLALTLSLSGDNFGAFIPLMADTPPRGDGVIAATLMVCGVGWVGAAGWVARRPGLQSVVARWGGWVLPVLLIVVGLYVLSNSPTDLR